MEEEEVEVKKEVVVSYFDLELPNKAVSKWIH
jgi:hypothetical protein